MTEDEIEAEYERNVIFMSKVIPPDDIYAFAESGVCMSYYFLQKWHKCEDVRPICETDPVAREYITLLLSYLNTRDISLNCDQNE